ncbi:MAG: winged helix-turn-helix domain-containing protein [Bacteroidota bacterium]
MEHDFYLADWLVQPRRHRLVREDAEARLTDRTVRALLRLAKTPGEVVTRDEMFEAVWPDTVVSDDSLFRTIADLRQALGDNARDPAYIETVRQVGYRLVAPVHSGDGWAARTEGDSVPEPVAPPPPVSPASVPRSGPSRWVLTVAGAALALIVLVGTAWALRSSGALRPAEWETRPLSTDPGIESFPSLSPDGQLVAYVRDPWTSGTLVVRRLDGDAASPVADSAGHVAYPAWSPGGDSLAFARYEGARVTLRVAPLVGGSERTVADLPCDACEVGGVSWHPVRGRLAFAVRQADQPVSISSLDLTTGAIAPLTDPPGGGFGDWQPAWSPSGEALAFLRGTAPAEIASGLTAVRGRVVVTRDGRTTAVTPSDSDLYGLTWLDDQTLVVAARVSGEGFGLWRVSLRGDEITRLFSHSAALFRNVSAAAGRLVFEEWNGQVDTWRVPLGEGDREPVLASTRSDEGARFSPDGKQVAFISSRSGTRELWVSRADGSAPSRETTFGEGAVGAPAWHPDGRQLVYVHTGADGLSTLHLADARGPASRVLWAPDRPLVAPSMTRDGTAVFVGAETRATWDIWRVPLDGTTPEPLGIWGARIAAESPDGSLIVALNGQDGLFQWRPGETPRRFSETPVARDWGNWALAGDRVVRLRWEEAAPERDDPSPVAVLDVIGLDGRPVGRRVLDGLAVPRGNLSLGVSADGAVALVSARAGTTADVSWAEAR